VQNCKSFLVTEAETKHVSRRARFQQHRDASCHQFFFLQGKAPEEIHALLTETLEKHESSMLPSKTGWLCLNMEIFSIYDAPHPERPKIKTTPEIFDQIHEVFLEGRRPDLG
jgi:hypothetical protein